MPQLGNVTSLSHFSSLVLQRPPPSWRGKGGFITAQNDERRLSRSHLPLIGLLQLVGVFVFRVLALLRLYRRVHPLFFDLGPRQVQILVGLFVRIKRTLRGPKRLFVLFLGLVEQDKRGLKLGMDSGTLGQVLKRKRVEFKLIPSFFHIQAKQLKHKSNTDDHDRFNENNE